METAIPMVIILRVAMAARTMAHNPAAMALTMEEAIIRAVAPTVIKKNDLIKGSAGKNAC